MHILFIAGNTRSLIANRGDLIREIKRRGHRVTALVPEYDFLPQIEQLDIPYRKISLSRSSVNPLAEMRSRKELERHIRELKPDKIFAYTIKPVVQGVPAAVRAGVPEVYSMITGMGYLFTGESLRQRILRVVACRLYKNALNKCTGIFFQNPDDIQLFQDLRIIRDDSPVTMTNGSGVNMEQFPREPLPETGAITFLVIARLLQDKGVREYVEAAKVLRRKYGDKVRFQIVGPYDPNLPHSVTEQLYKSWLEEDDVELLGHQADVKPWLRLCHIYVLPSYREGTPRSVLEAMSTGRAIITTDTPGCRETVKDGKTGFLVPAKEWEPLAMAMEKFVKNPQLINEMAEESWKYVVEKYDVKKVNDAILQTMKL